MTAEQVPSRVPMTSPFAQSGNRTFIDTDNTNNMNFPKGFPDAFSAPGSQGGKYLQRSELNALGHIATNDLFYHKCGGLNTFDPEFAAAVGGYPKGAVLQYFNGQDVLTLISLVDNNNSNFITDGISLDHWRVSGDKIKSEYFVGLSYDSTVGFSNTNIQVIGTFKAPLSGTVSIANLEASYIISEDDPTPSHSVDGIIGAAVVALKNSYEFTKNNYANINLLSGIGPSPIYWGIDSSSNAIHPSYDPIQCSTGDIIAIGIQNGWFSVSGSSAHGRTLKLSFEVRIV